MEGGGRKADAIKPIGGKEGLKRGQGGGGRGEECYFYVEVMLGKTDCMFLNGKSDLRLFESSTRGGPGV